MATEAGLEVAELHGAVLRSSAAAMLGPHLLGLRKAVPELMEEDGPLLARSVLDLLGLAVATSGRVGAARRSGAAPRNWPRAGRSSRNWARPG